MIKESNDLIVNSARRTIETEAAAIAGLAHFIDENLIKAVEAITASKGRLIVSGIGKSAIVAQKIVATMNSTGTPALFMHAADAIHGDLGMITADDVVMVLSKSGDSAEIKMLAPLVKSFGNTLIAMTGNMSSYLSAHAHITLNTTVAHEACPNNLAPTSSTTAQMVMGDALAICLMETKGFNAADFAKVHPGGSLGKKLYLRAGDMITQHERPAVHMNDSIKQAIMEITKKRLGATAVLDDEEKIVGVITDGDVRRMFEKFEDYKNLTAKDVMSFNPKKVDEDLLAVEALEILRTNNISQLIITANGKYAGILHLHDLVREGII